MQEPPETGFGEGWTVRRWSARADAVTSSPSRATLGMNRVEEMQNVFGRDQLQRDMQFPQTRGLLTTRAWSEH